MNSLKLEISESSKFFGLNSNRNWGFNCYGSKRLCHCDSCRGRYRKRRKYYDWTKTFSTVIASRKAFLFFYFQSIIILTNGTITPTTTKTPDDVTVTVEPKVIETRLPITVPIRYDLQLQLPTSSTKDPLVPTFFGSLRIEFQLTRALRAVTVTNENDAIEDGDNWKNPTGVTLIKNHSYTNSQIANNFRFWHSPRFAPSEQRVAPPPSARRFRAGAFVELRLAAHNLDAFENVTLRATGVAALIPVIGVRLRDGEAILRVAERRWLDAGRYTLNIERFQGFITYEKGIYYRDAGGYPVLGMDLFPNYTHTVFPCMGGPLTKTTLQLALIHPRDTVALSSMSRRETPRQLNENWLITKFVQAPNLAAYMFTVVVLPIGIYEQTIVSSDTAGDTSLHVWTNRVSHRAALKHEVSRWATCTFVRVAALVGEPLPLAHVDILLMNEFNGSHSFGVITLGVEEWDASDDAHRIALLARQFARQWLGGMTTVADYSHFCIQEDFVEYIVAETMRAVLRDAANGDAEVERYFLARYIRMHVAEVFLAPGESVTISAANTFARAPTQQTVDTHCGLKGAQMLHSLDTVVGPDDENYSANEPAIVTRTLRHILRVQRYKSFTLDDILGQLRGTIVDAVDLAQIYEFWVRNGGLPNVLVEKHADRMRLTQLNAHRSAQYDAGAWTPMPLWPLRIAVRNVTLPLSFMLNQALELAPLNPKLLALTNPGFEHWYRVNYDAVGWERVARNFDASLGALGARNRAQLLNDFCYFYAVGQIDAGATDALRVSFVALMRNRYEHFELCELYAFWCSRDAGKRKINMDASAERVYYELVRDRVWPALRHHREYECGGPGAVADSANALCRVVFGADCL